MELENTLNANFSQADLPELLVQYYQRLFPYKEFFNWLSYNDSKTFQNREFCFTLKDDVYIRYLSFANRSEMEKEIQKRQPYKIDIGAVYSHKPKVHKTVPVGLFNAEEKELVFDIDMTDYDEIRTCCSGASICPKCWPLMTLAIRILDRALSDDFGFKHRLWVYSGRRGVHCWVCDEEARKLSPTARSAVAEYLSIIKGGDHQAKKVNFGRSTHPSISKALIFVTEYFTQRFLEDQGILDSEENWKNVLAIIPEDSVRNKLNKLWLDHSTQVSSKQKWEELCKELERHKNLSKKMAEEIMCQYVYPRLDINVSKGLNHLLKSPFCVHPKTGRVCVPIDTQKLDEFDPFVVPTISTLCKEIDAYDKNSKKSPQEEGMEVDDNNSDKIENVKAYEKTSLLDSMRLFQKFISKLEKTRYIAEQQKKSKPADPASW